MTAQKGIKKHRWSAADVCVRCCRRRRHVDRGHGVEPCVPLEYEWCATTNDTEQHAHGCGPHSIAYGARLCAPNHRVMSPRYWAENHPQPKKRCRACVRLAKKTPRVKRKDPES